MGQFYTLFYKLKKDEDEFCKYIRMSVKCFDEVLSAPGRHFKTGCIFGTFL
jgi:hypothetical protein